MVDGDTLDVVVDLGLRIEITQRIRLHGVDTPERGDDGFTEAKDFVKEFCRPDIPFGWPLRIHTIKPRDKYGRWLAQVWRDGENLSQVLIDKGLAVAYGG